MKTTFTIGKAVHECALEITGNSAVMSTFGKVLTVGQQVSLAETTWVVTGTTVSPYMKNVTNVSLRRVNDNQI